MDEHTKDPHGSGTSDTRRGEDVSKQEREAGRHDTGPDGAMGRPTGESTARDRTGVDPKESVTDES